MTWSLLFLGFVRETKLCGVSRLDHNVGLWVDLPELHGVGFGEDALHRPPGEFA